MRAATRIALLCFLGPGPTSLAVAQSEPGNTRVSLVEFTDISDSTRANRRVPMKIHLPAGRGPFPVVVVSHGAGGNLDANFAQAHHLASHGFLAVCLEHIGSNTKRALAGGFRIGKATAEMTRDANEVLNRPRDVSFAIDQIEKWNKTHPKLRGRCDLKRLGVMGHSYGAYTTLAICGARPALDWLKPKVGAGKGLGPDLSDKRVSCGVALSPQGPGEPFFLESSYRTLRVPLLGISGTKDVQQSNLPIHRKKSFRFWPKGDRYLLWINNASHLQFSDPTGSRQRRTNLGARLRQRREDVQKVSRAATLIFFDKYLRGKRTVELREADLKKHMGGIVDGIELLKK